MAQDRWTTMVVVVFDFWLLSFAPGLNVVEIWGYGRHCQRAGGQAVRVAGLNDDDAGWTEKNAPLYDSRPHALDQFWTFQWCWCMQSERWTFIVVGVDVAFDSRFSSFEPKLNVIGLEIVGAAVGDAVDGPEVKLRK